jgi:signal transduction histidine kinase
MVSPRVMVVLFVTLSALMLATAWLERAQSRKEVHDLMTQQAHTLLESLMAASGNALLANDLLEIAVRRRLLDNADVIRRMYERGEISDAFLARFGEAHNLHRVRIVRPDGRWVFSSHPRIAGHDSSVTPRPDLSPIFSGEVDTLVIGLRQARFEDGYRYGMALAARDRSAVIVNLDAGRWLAIRREIGFGPLLRSVAETPGIVYVALQDTTQVLAAAGRTDLLSASGDAFLQAALRDTSLAVRERILERDSVSVLEVAHPFFYRGAPVGVFRLGLSRAPLQAIDARILRRLALVTFVILVVGFLVLTFVVARQNADLLARQVRAVETYSGRVIEHVGDGILVFNDETGILTINRAAQELLRVREADVLGRPVTKLLANEACRTFLRSAAVRDQVDCDLPHGRLRLLMAKSVFEDEHGRANTILILRDRTRLKQLEAQVQQRERLHAMGALASGLAHEIRNPLNAVGTIVQQLRKDFRPVEDAEDYEELTAIVYQEVRRINDAVRNFLRMVRPEPIRPELFDLEELMRFVEQEYAASMAERGVRLRLRMAWRGDVQWDRRQMQQVLMNLVRNAMEATGEGGRIDVSVERPEEAVIEIRVADDGPGIPADVKDRIFNLYFTTKAAGTGIGLSIVQRIVQEHGGAVEVESTEGEGTTFILRLPQWITERNRKH